MHKPILLSKGFTMIELVIVIAIIGILAAAAIPRYGSLGTQAQTSANQGFAGDLNAAINIAHAAWIAAGTSGSTSTITLDGIGIEINGNGWVDGGANSTTTITAAQCITLASTILVDPPQLVTSGCTILNCYVATASSSICTYTLNSSSHTVTYDMSAGLVTAS